MSEATEKFADPAQPVEVTGRALARRKFFASDRRGVAATEFAILAFPFFLVFFGIIETGMVFMGEMSLGYQVQSMARTARTGKVTQIAMSQDAFRKQLCNSIEYLFDCSKLKIDLRSYGSFTDLPKTPPIKNGAVDVDNFVYETPSASQIMALRVYYEWPLFTGFMSKYLADLSDGNRLMGATSIFRTEPF